MIEMVMAKIRERKKHTIPTKELNSLHLKFFNVWLKACNHPIETFMFLVQYIMRILQLIKKQAFLSAVL